MKKTTIIGMLGIFIIFIFTGCKVDTDLQADFDKAEGDLKIALEEITLLNEENQEFKNELEVSNSKNKEFEDQINTLQGELAEAVQNSNENDNNSLSSTGYLTTALEVLDAIAANDFTIVSGYVHPSLGVRFTAYPFIDTATDLVFTSAQINSIASDTTIYTWGAFDGSGEPIELNFADYYDEFIYDEDYVDFDILGNNTTLVSGNSLNNQSNAYPVSSFVDFHFTGFDAQYEGMDWTTLRLVFEEVSGVWYLVGVVHGQWTI